jgi:CRISPR-associated endoribonuclease Cas6
MRITCLFRIDNLPIAYQMAMVSLIKEALKHSNESLYTSFYQTTLQMMKPFAFSTYFRNFEIKENEIKTEEMTLTISSPDAELILHLLNGFQSQRKFQYKGYSFELQDIRLLHERAINGNIFLCKTLSPLLIEDKSGKPVSPNHPDYNEHVNYLADLILMNYRGFGLLEPIQIKSIDLRKVVVKTSNREFCEKYGDEQFLYFTGYKGMFLMKGHEEDLKLLYQLGLSKRRNQGFGLFEVEEVF